MKVNIFGSCYTRELFNYQENYEVGCYVMQQSLFTLYAKPLEITLDQARSADGTNFKRRMMYYEFNKLGLKKVLEEPADYLIIDFADCRYDIYDFKKPEGVRIIYTHDSRATFDNIKDDPRFKEIEKEYYNVEEHFDDKKIEEILTRFVGEILEVFDAKHVILNRMQMNDTYYEAGEKKVLENNFHYGKRHFIKKIEDIFLKLLPDCGVLNTKDLAVLYINHRFGGPHPMHFEDIYYKYRMNVLDCLINKKDINAVEKEYKDIYSKEIDEIKNKKKDEGVVLRSAERVD